MQTSHDVSCPTAVALVQGVAAQVDIVQATVHEEAGILGEQIVHVGAQTCLVTLDDVAVGGVQQVVAVVEAVLRDGIVGEVVVQVQVDHQFRSECVVDQREVVGLLHVEVWVTVVEGDGVRLVDVWVQVGDTRAADAHVVGEAEVAAL